MKVFKFQKFVVQQKPEVFSVGTDAVLLGALADGSNAHHALEVGAGTGIISLMLAQRFPKLRIKAVDVNEAAAQLSEKNFQQSPFKERLSVVCADFKSFSPAHEFDLIFSNPPYFEPNASEKAAIARQTRLLNFKDLIKKSQQLLSPQGRLSVIIPIEAETEFVELANNNTLYLKRKVNVRGIEEGKIRRVVLEFTRAREDTDISELVIEKSPRVYSDQYLELTKDFHVFR